MAISLVIKDPRGEFLESPYVILEDEVLRYFTELPGFPMLNHIGALDPYGDALLSQSDLRHVAEEAELLLKRLSSEGIPSPPLLVGVNPGVAGDIGEPFGVKELEVVCRALIVFAGRSRGVGCESWAIGD